MNYRETLDYLYSALPMYQRMGKAAFKKDLTNIRELSKQLGNPHQKFPSVHVGGTNGKGSSAHMMASVLHVSGYKTGLYTSPHLKSFTERIKINGENIPEERVVSFVAENQRLIEKVQPSFFEMSVAMAFDHFAKNEVDIAIIEVGLGGRLDSTNIINPELSLITNISLDHTQMLGNTIEKIAREKAGIIKETTPIVIGESQQKAEEIFKVVSKEKKAPIYFADKIFNASKTAEGFEFKSEQFGRSITFDLPFWPSYQLNNILGVLTSLALLMKMGYKIEKAEIKNGIENFHANTGFKGRWQVINQAPFTICDTAHNEAGIRSAMAELGKRKYSRLHVVLGMVDDKNAEEILSLFPSEAIYYFCQPDIPRAMDVENIFTAAQKVGLKGEVIKKVSEAIKKANQVADPDRDLIYIGGSTFVVAEVIDL